MVGILPHQPSAKAVGEDTDRGQICCPQMSNIAPLYKIKNGNDFKNQNSYFRGLLALVKCFKKEKKTRVYL
jgi:hypothetical protein